MPFQNVLFPAEGLVKPLERKSKGGKLRGCDVCPRNKVKGITKIIGKVRGRRIFVWAQSPGPTENEKGRELLGRAGRYFWDRMLKVGIHREDCDIQNVVRCFPADWHGGQLEMRDPTDIEVHCCSVFTDKAILQSKARIHLILGRIAAVNLLGKQAAKDKGQIFWSDKLQAKVIIADHPSYLLRIHKDPERVAAFDRTLRAVKQASLESGGKYSYLEKQDYKGVTAPKHGWKVYRILKSKGRRERITVDIETDKIDGVEVILCVGFSYKPGWARTLYVDHPLANMTPAERRAMRELVMGLLRSARIRKVFQRGTSDIKQVRKIWGCQIRGYDWDTNYSEYLKYPGRRSYKLSEIAIMRFPEFIGYKDITWPEAYPPGLTKKQALALKDYHLSKLPIKKMTLYNGADCDLEKRIEVSTKTVPHPLLKTYMDAAFTLERMEANGPFFDYKHRDKLVKLYPARVKALRRKLQVLAGDPHLNPNTPQEIADVIYDKLGLLEPDRNGKTPTGKLILERIASEHPFVKATIDYRTDKKIESTYLNSFAQSADMNKGRLKTFWWLTGTATGRLSSGGESKADEGLVNLQNIHGNPFLQNMLISDPNWRVVYDYLEGNDAPGFDDLDIFIAFDYSQAEIRVLAQMSKDPELIKLFNKKKGKEGVGDIHCEVGHAITGWSVASIYHDAQVRKLVKNIHFGMVYGLTPDGMLKFVQAKGVKTTIGKIKKYMAAYFDRFGGVKELIDRLHLEAEVKGWVGNMFGFRRPLKVTEEHTEGDVFWKNQAVNSPIQGGAHHLLLIVLQLLQRKPQTFKLLRTPTMEVHDALVSRVKLRQLNTAYELGKNLLEHDVLKVVREEYKVDWQIPLEAEAKVGFRYGVKVDYDPSKPKDEFLKEWAIASRAKDKALGAELEKFQREGV